MRERPPKRNIRLPEGYEQKASRRHASEPGERRAAEPGKRPAASRAQKPARLRQHTRAKRGRAAPQSRRRLLRRALCGLLAVFLLVCVGLGGYLAASTHNDFLWLELEQLPHRDATILYGQDRESGEWVEYARLEATQQKIWTPLSEIPLAMQHAFVAIEDKHFYTHHGVSFTRTVYAVLNEAKKMLTGSYFGNGIKQGASTIDQQLIKNLTRDDEASGLDGYLRKVREIWRALCLDAKYDKDQIMEAYLNVISFTDNTAGVQAESIKLCGRPAMELSLAQCASIASITKNPYRYDPRSHPEEHLARRNYILYEMWQQGYIAQEEYEEASAQPIGLSPGDVPVAETPTTSYFTDQVLTEVSAELAARYHLDKDETTNLLYNGGLRIYTTVDPVLQAEMERALAEEYEAFFPTRGLGVPTQATKYDSDGAIVRDENGEPVKEDVIETPQAAMVSVGYDGSLRAMVGGIGEKQVSRGLNRAAVPRQVGSTMKPIGAYALALEKNRIHWSTPLLDAPVRQIEDAATGQPKDWPANFSKTYAEKDLLVADALARSINTVAVRVGELAGVDSIYRFVQNSLGVSTLTPEDRDAGPMVLGAQTRGISPYQLAGAYLMLGNGGTFTTLHCYTSVQTGEGREIAAPRLETKQVISADTAYVMNRLLAGVMQGDGTAAGYRVQGGMDSIGKTGTSSDNRDYWFVGLTPYTVTACWYGYDSGFALNVRGGTHAPTAAWKRVTERAQQGLPTREFPVDDTVAAAEYCTVSGGLAGPGCPARAVGYYRAGHLPAACADHAA